MDIAATQSTEKHASWAAERWLATACARPNQERLCHAAAAELGRRTGLLPLVAPAVMSLLFVASPALLAHWVLSLPLYLVLLTATLARIRLGHALTHKRPRPVRAARYYQTAVDLAGFAWGCLTGILVLTQGLQQTTELALIATLLLVASGLTTLTVERSLWLRFTTALWTPLMTLTAAAGLQGVASGWTLLLVEGLFASLIYVHGRRMVSAYINSLLTQSHLEKALQEIGQQRDELRQNQARLQALVARTHELSHYDELTGIGSRQHFYERLETAISAGRIKHSRFALLYIDIDGFRDINNTFGHQAGDQLLQTVARRVSKLLRATDFAARLGSDELAMLIDGVTDEHEAILIAERCLDTVQRPTRLNGRTVTPQIHIGIAVYPHDGRYALELLKAGESAMSAAKHEVRRQYTRYLPEMSQAAERRMTIAQELRQALVNGEFVLDYQPQFDGISGRLCGVEALVRWRHPDRGTVPPREFIPIAERIGLIDELGEWVLLTACRQAVSWFESDMAAFTVAVNISPLQLLNPDFVSTVRNALELSALPPRLLELEIVESAVQTQAASRDALSELRQLGVRIAIDDFGTGYSSLGSLKDLPIDCVKIDRAFVCNILSNPRESALLGTIVDMVHVLGCGVVAEGVENAQQRDKLTALGCDCLQGYYLSRPIQASLIPGVVANIRKDPVIHAVSQQGAA